MASQRFWCFMLTWILVFFLPSVCSEKDALTLNLESTVFVALKGKELNIKYHLKNPANQTKDTLKCYNPLNKQIYNCVISATAGQPESVNETFVLKDTTISGEYYCQYKTAKAYWFLQVRDGGYREAIDLEFIMVVIFIGVLLIFSVVGSMYVFRGHWKERITECGNSGRKRKQNQEERTEEELKEDHVDVTASSTSFYASLEPRPRSIYAELDHSAANREPDQRKAAPKTKETTKTKVQTTQQQDEGVFESVYENF